MSTIIISLSVATRIGLWRLTETYWRLTPADQLLVDAVHHGLSVHQIAALHECGTGDVRQRLAALSMTAPDWPKLAA